MAEYLGAKIALISRSDIRYVGTLHEINSGNHTVALESVTSHGTEGRKGNPAEEILGSDQVYEYIVFRGSDVKELNIVTPASQMQEKKPSPPQMPNDPAILGSARPQPSQQQEQQQPPYQNQFRGPQPPYPQQHPQYGYQGPPPPNQFQGQPRFQGPGGPHGFPGSPGAVPGYGFAPPPPGYGMGFNGPPPPGHGFPPQFPPGHGPPHQQYPGPPGPQMNQQRPPQQMPNQNQQQQPPVSSKQGTPQPQQQNQAPPPQAPLQPDPKPVEMSATPGPSSDSPAGPPPPVESKPSVADATAPPAAPQQASQPQQAKAAQRAPTSRVAVPLQPPQQRSTAPNQPASAQPQSFADATQAATAAVAAAMAKLGPVNSQQQTDGATDNLSQKVSQMRIQDQQYRGGRGTRSRGINASRGGARSREIELPKEDYDFESANAKFNKQELVKEAIATGSPNPISPNGDGAADPLASAGANGHTADTEKEATDDGDVVIPPAEKSYDKKSSFFDNISSDLKDRVEAQQSHEGGRGGFDGRAMRTQERSKNFETFGQSNVDGGGHRGGHRGRGRGYGYRGGDRGRGGYRGRGGFEGRGGGGHRGSAPNAPGGVEAPVAS